MAYNQKIEISTSTCINPGLSYCEEWTETKETTYNVYDFLYLSFKITLAIVIIFILTKKRK